MNAIERLIETILPEFLSFIENQENLKNGKKELDLKDNTQPNLTSLCLRKNDAMRGEQRREYQDIFSSCLTKQSNIFFKPKGRCAKAHLNRNFVRPVYPDTCPPKIHNLSDTSAQSHNNSQIRLDIIPNTSVNDTNKERSL